MKNIIKILLFSLVALGLQAQTKTPNTTLCGAVTATNQNVICLTSATSIVNNTQLLVDEELMTVVLSNNQSVTAGAIPVRRGGAAAGSGPTAHNNGALVWEALTPAYSALPGVNGFNMGLTLNDVGPCIRANQIYLPHIYPNLSVKRDCNVGTTLASGISGFWVDYAPGAGLDKDSPTPQALLTTNGALTVSSGSYLVTKAGVLALTLAAPTAGVQDGMIIRISSTTAFAHTLTATGLLSTGTASTDVATFAARAGAGLVLKAYNGLWIVLSSVGITFS